MESIFFRILVAAAIALPLCNTVAAQVTVRDKAFFQSKTYQWTDSKGQTHESNLAEIATDPSQIIAMIRKVYTDKEIPGNKKRGYNANGGFPDKTSADHLTDENWSRVSYPAIGTISHTGSVYTNAASYKWTDTYGWDISTQKPIEVNSITINKNECYYATFNQWEYEPHDEGLTMLLVEVNDDYDKEKYNKIQNPSLKQAVETMIKSVRVITDARHTGSGDESGTLLKIDCDKMNKFYLMAKGQVRLPFCSTHYLHKMNSTSAYFNPYPMFLHFNKSGVTDLNNSFINFDCREPFYNMFEQFSPVDVKTMSSGVDDLYQELINMKSFPVLHDCFSVPLAYVSGQPNNGHEFMMYGYDSGHEDCQDVRDLMFFVPDYRMKYWTGRKYNGNPTDRLFLNYNEEHQPSMGLYVIRQDDITINPGHVDDNHYMLQLIWRTNLDAFLPSEDQEFELLQVVIDEETGEEKYDYVYYRDDNGNYLDGENGNIVDENDKVPIKLTMDAGEVKSYSNVYVERLSNSQQVTFAIRGRDKGGFLSLQVSNRKSYIIPGIDPSEIVLLEDATHYSRFNPDNQENCYSNKLLINNNVDGMKAGEITHETTLTITRTPQGGQAETIATITFNPDQNNYTIHMAGQKSKEEFPEASDHSGYAGYHANNNGTIEGNATWTQSYTITGDGCVNMGSLVIYDNFAVGVDKNDHPGSYYYNVTSNYPVGDKTAHSNTFRVPVYKTDSRINGSFTKQQIDDDEQATLAVEDNVNFEELVQYNSKTEVLRYDAYRWLDDGSKLYIVSSVYDNDTEKDVAPTGLAGNQGDSYTISMNSGNLLTTGVVDVTAGSAWATFVDKSPAAQNAAAAYVYAPVIETFTTGNNAVGVARHDYNTYGGPLQRAAKGLLSVAPAPGVSPISQYSWTDDNGNRYAYYNVVLNINQDDIPTGYEVYKVRAWRLVNPSLLGEQTSNFAYRMQPRFLFDTILGEDYQPGKKMQLGGTEIEGYFDENSASFVTRGTFGARKVRTGGDNQLNDGCIDQLDMQFIVRLYFAPASPASGTTMGINIKDNDALDDARPFYIVEDVISHTIYSGVTTGITTVDGNRQLVNVKYYNTAGVAGDRPFKGINIVVKSYSDGSRQVVKIVK